MLTLCFQRELNNLGGLYRDLGIDGNPAGANFVFLDDDKQVGLMRIRFQKQEAVVDAVRFLPSVSDEDKDFFFRAMLFKLSLGAEVTLVFNGEYSQLQKFGFILNNGKTAVSTAKINLHSDCGKRK